MAVLAHFFFKVMVETWSVLVCQVTLWNQSETRSCQERPKGPKTNGPKMGDFQRRQQSWRTLSRLWERLKLFWTSHMSGYHMEPIRDNKDFKGAVRNVNNGPKGLNGKKGFFKGDGSLDKLFQGNTRNWRCFELFTCQGTFWNQS